MRGGRLIRGAGRMGVGAAKGTGRFANRQLVNHAGMVVGAGALLGAAVGGARAIGGGINSVGEAMSGDPEFLRTIGSAAIKTSFNETSEAYNPNRRQTLGPSEYQYGQRTHPRNASPDGSMVFGMWNLRR